jgi:hypothetical protein
MANPTFCFRPKPWLGGPAQVLEYLARYTHRIAISNERLTSLHDGTVTFSVRNNEQDGRRKRQEQLPTNVFIQRFVQHVLPSGLKRIRHYGVLACAIKMQNWPYAARP